LHNLETPPDGPNPSNADTRQDNLQDTNNQSWLHLFLFLSEESGDESTESREQEVNDQDDQTHG